MCTHFSAHDNRFLYKEGVIIASVNKCSGNRFNIFKFYMNFKVEIHCTLTVMLTEKINIKNGMEVYYSLLGAQSM